MYYRFVYCMYDAIIEMYILIYDTGVYIIYNIDI